MRDWRKELPPGTLLCRKADKVFALVISVNVIDYPGPWHQLHLVLLTSQGQIIEDNREVGVFYDQWLKVLT